MKKVFIWVIGLVMILVLGFCAFYLYQKPDLQPVLQKAQKDDLIIVDNPLINQMIKSPLVVRGKAKGFWFFEASFPVVLVNWDGLIIAEGLATAKGDWMTEEFVPFEANIDFTINPNTYSNRGALILKKDNPSGLPEHDDALEMPIIFADVLNKN